MKLKKKKVLEKRGSRRTRMSKSLFFYLSSHPKKLKTRADFMLIIDLIQHGSQVNHRNFVLSYLCVQT